MSEDPQNPGTVDTSDQVAVRKAKRERLLEAGAHFLAPGLEDGAALLEHLRVD